MHQYQFPMAANTVTMVVTRIVNNGSAPEDYQVLLAKRASNADAYPDYWSLPGGFVNAGTETVREAASRELLEECNMNIHPDHWRFIDLDDQPSKFKSGGDTRYDHVINHCFHIILVDNYVNNNIMNNAMAADDVQELEWVTLDEAMKYDLAFRHNMILGWVIPPRHAN